MCSSKQSCTKGIAHSGAAPLRLAHDVQPLIRFVEHLPKNGDLELSVLKCHLLVEEVLTKLILDSVKHPEHVQKARLTFAQKVSMARSVSDLKQTWVWGAVGKLNDARNQLAHGLGVEQIQVKLQDFVRFVEAEQGAPEADVISQSFGRFHWAAFKVFGVLSAYAHFDPTAFKTPGAAARVLLGVSERHEQPDLEPGSAQAPEKRRSS